MTHKAKCRACGAAIIFIPTQGGKNMPCDAEPVMYWAREKGKDKIVTPNGEVVPCSFMGETEKTTGIGYVPHWATCPSAGNFRRVENKWV